ncbi:MAG TPA: ATP-binding protein [Bryobacteraceae bacterium]|jgi:signal transduction histidine kinase|nr:ATP-binding protein [Bryobacteraceae bacterium]
MTFRTRLLLIVTVAVVTSVCLVEWLVSATTRERFERLETQRVDALVAQFRSEYERRRLEIARAVNGIAASDTAVNIAAKTDYSTFYADAASLAAAHGLDLLELVAADGSIISSAEWPARFGYKEDWLTSRSNVSPLDWLARGAFLRREELPDGVTLAIEAVGVATAGDRLIYVVGGQRLDRAFLSTLALPAGMRALLYRNLQPQFTPSELIGGDDAADLRPLIERVERDKREAGALIGAGASAETVHALPLAGLDDNLLGVLLVASARRELVEMEAFLLKLGIAFASFGIVLGLALSGWATARITRPVKRLAESARKVAAGNWGATVEVVTADEIGQLAQAFNRMTHELVEQRERLVQSERVAAWRELARRLAHELKNPLFPLQITVENMRRAREQYPDQFDEVFREGSSTLLAELANLRQIVSRFSDFAKMPAPAMHPVQLNDIAAETVKLFAPQLEQAHITARTELSPNLRTIMADPEQLSRVMRNLTLNAIDAMPKGGTLTIRTMPHEEGVRLEVADTGQGLTPEECERLFTPYYTTKTHGTGLGLAIVQSVVSDHRGRISVASEPGRGASFRIDLS